MANGSGIVWRGDLNINLENLDRKAVAGIAAAAHKIAPEAEAWMKTNARWTDRTGNARNGLRATAQVSGKGAAIVLSHSVPYGIWLEIRWSGRYSIIGPAIPEFAPRYINLAGRLLFGGLG